MVLSDRSPLSAARVYAYQVSDLSLTKATTGGDGTFLFNALPAGVYKIIAYKSGFVPAIALVTRAAQQATDYLEFELIAETQAAGGGAGDFWSVRRKIPTDVLRQIELAEMGLEETPIVPHRSGPRAETRIVSGYGRAGSTELGRTDAHIGLESKIGSSTLRIDGDFQNLEPRSSFTSAGASVVGETTSILASIEMASGSNIRFGSTSHSLQSAGVTSPTDVRFESIEIGWSKQIDPRTQSGVSLLLLDEHNFNTQGALVPSGVPQDSKSWRLGGHYSRQFNQRFGFRSGVSYQHLLDQDGASDTAVPVGSLPREKIDAFGVGSARLKSGILVEYGLYSTMRDGSVSMSPHGGLVLNLGSRWKADAIVRERITAIDPQARDFSLAYYGGSDHADADRHFYQLGFERRTSDVESFRIGATHREISDTLRMFFSDDFLEQVESLYLVRGDELPEVHMALSRRLSKKIIATLQTQYGSGGGGILTTEDASRFKNRVRYLVTSLDTHFARTATGVFLAFHRVEQSLDPLVSSVARDETGLDRLQLRLTQELGFLVNLGAEWALLLNVELTRGATPFSLDLDPEEVRSQVAGGIAVKF